MRENFTINLLLPLLSSYLFFSVHSDVLAVAQKPSPAATWKLREPGRISSPWETELIENWKSLFVLTQNVPVMRFQGSNWMQFAAVKLCMVPPNASLSIPWVPVHGCQCHGHTQFHFTAALSVLSLSLSIWLAPGKVLHLPCISAFTSHPSTHQGRWCLAPDTNYTGWKSGWEEQCLPSYYCECVWTPLPAATLGLFGALHSHPSPLCPPGLPGVFSPC